MRVTLPQKARHAAGEIQKKRTCRFSPRDRLGKAPNGGLFVRIPRGAKGAGHSRRNLPESTGNRRNSLIATEGGSLQWVARVVKIERFTHGSVSAKASPSRTPPGTVNQPPPLTISLLPCLARGNVCLMSPEVSRKPSKPHSNDAKLTVPNR